VLCRGVAAWSSRRARTRARRALIRERIENAAVVELEAPESIDEHLLERIGVYTCGDEAFALDATVLSRR